jgi:hypothetical protein
MSSTDNTAASDRGTLVNPVDTTHTLPDTSGLLAENVASKNSVFTVYPGPSAAQPSSGSYSQTGGSVLANADDGGYKDYELYAANAMQSMHTGRGQMNNNSSSNGVAKLKMNSVGKQPQQQQQQQSTEEESDDDDYDDDDRTQDDDDNDPLIVLANNYTHLIQQQGPPLLPSMHEMDLPTQSMADSYMLPPLQHQQQQEQQHGDNMYGHMSEFGLDHDDQVTVQLLQTLQTFVSDQHGNEGEESNAGYGDYMQHYPGLSEGFHYLLPQNTHDNNQYGILDCQQNRNGGDVGNEQDSNPHLH